MKKLARTLRKKSTDAERLLWRRLRNRFFAGFRFRRQETIGPYIVDFVCFELKAIIETDGGQHSTIENEKRDADRARYLASCGYRIIRFWNHEILGNIDIVLEKIYTTVMDPPHPVPLPVGEGTLTIRLGEKV